MKKKLNFGIIALLMLCLFAACSDDDNNGKDIELTDDTSTSQIIYADETTNSNSGIKFSTTGPWQATVKEIATKSNSSKVDWLTLSQYSGDKSGDYTLTLTLKENHTGISRKAEIQIVSGSNSISITVEQKGTKEDGEKPIEEANYSLGFILLKDNSGAETTTPGAGYSTPLRTFELIMTDEMGNTKNTITSFTDTCNFVLLNYNETTKDVYIQRYSGEILSDSSMISSDSSKITPYTQTVSELLAVNMETKKTRTIAWELPDYDQLYMSADGNYIVYDKVYMNADKQQIVKKDLTNEKEVILSESTNSKGGASIRSINKDGSIVILTEDNKIMVMEGNVEKHSFTEGSGDYIEAYLSPNETQLVIQYGQSGLKVCNLNGDNKEIIKADAGDTDIYIESLLWSIDSKYVYIDDYNKENSIYKVDVNKKDTQLLTDKFPIDFLYKGSLSIKISK